MKLSLQSKLEEAGYNIDTLATGTIETFKKSVAGIARASQAEWTRLAQQRLTSSKDDYINGLRKAESFTVKTAGDVTIFEIQLVGRMPNNFEFGMPSFDMKSIRPGWLGGAKSKASRDGSRYITIPFRHSTSSSSRISYTGKAARDDLRSHLRETVRRYGLDRMVRAGSGQVVEGPVRRVPSRAADTHRYLRGLTRIQQRIEGTTPSGLGRGSSQLMTWRRMSENSDASSWIHPGLGGAKILPEVERFADKEMNRIIELILG